MKKSLTIIFCLSTLLAFSQDYAIWYTNGVDTTLVKNGTDSAFTTAHVFIAKVKTGDRPMNNLQINNASLQPVLVNGTTIKTINGVSILGSGNLVVSGNVTSIVGITGTLSEFNTAITDGNIGNGDALVANTLSQFSATTTAQLAGVLSDEVGLLGGFKREASIKLGSNYTNNTTTGTEITGLQISSTGTGLLNFEYILFVQSAATTTGWKIGINYTGTATVLALNMTYPSTGGAAATGVGENIVLNNTGSIYEASANTAVSTTAPNLGPTAGVAAANTNVMVKVFGVLNVTVSGDLEIWAGSETTSQISVMTNSFGTANLR